MGIYLPNMEMPTSCRACHLKMNCDDCEGFECVCVPLHQQIGYLDDLLTDKRRDDCPLVPVPPHGRLIDGDKLNDYLKTAAIMADGEAKDAYIDARAEAKTMPTIIPAVEGE